MFIPEEFEFNDKNEIIAFIKQYSFGMLVSSVADALLATHLPFHIRARDEQTILTGHMAIANEQWKNIDGKTVMAIFSQPNAYISPAHYKKLLNVPTWNYIAVHVYGTFRIINQQDKGMEILEQMILQNEPGYKLQWDELPDDYKTRLYREIIPFEISITDIKATAKLSQNKTETERKNIIEALAASGDCLQTDIASFMKKACPY